jgi:hypothetical protein
VDSGKRWAVPAASDVAAMAIVFVGAGVIYVGTHASSSGTGTLGTVAPADTGPDWSFLLDDVRRGNMGFLILGVVDFMGTINWGMNDKLGVGEGSA